VEIISNASNVSIVPDFGYTARAATRACVKYRIEERRQHTTLRIAGSSIEKSLRRRRTHPNRRCKKTSSSFPPPRRIPVEVAANGAGVGGQSQFRTRPPRRHSGTAVLDGDDPRVPLDRCILTPSSHTELVSLFRDVSRYSGRYTLSRPFLSRGRTHCAAKHLITTRRWPTVRRPTSHNSTLFPFPFRFLSRKNRLVRVCVRLTCAGPPCVFPRHSRLCPSLSLSLSLSAA